MLAGLIALVAIGSPALGAPDASESPRVTGPLVPGYKDCSIQRTQSDTGEVGVVTKKCVRLYEYDQAKEDNPNRDYGVAWVQTSLTPRNGWCLVHVESAVLNNDNNILKKEPGSGFKVSRTKPITSKLVATAGGDGTKDAVVKNTFPMRPGRVRRTTDFNGRYFKVFWDGATTKPIAFALGIEVWWNPETQTAPNADAGLESRLRRNC